MAQRRRLIPVVSLVERLESLPDERERIPLSFIGTTMIGQVLDAVIHWLKRVITQPREELDRWQKAVRFAYDLGRYGARQLRHDRAQQMAAALAFRTLFGLLPVFVVATVLVNALGLQDSFIEPLTKLFEFWGLGEIQVLLPTDGSAPSVTLADWLADRVREAERMNWAAIGWVGVAVTLYAAIGQMVAIEDSFNIIYRAPRGRPWSFRIPLYWFALTISPLMIMGSAYVSNYFGTWLDQLNSQAWLAAWVDVAWSLLSIWAVLLFVYILLPNTRVRFRPALAGSFVAAALLEIGKRFMGVYLSKALSISQLYGSLGLVPLFMFWVYLMWLAVLFGLQVSSTLQHLRGRQLAELEKQQTEPLIVEPAAVLILMKYIARRFQEGKSTPVQLLVRRTGLGEGIVERLVSRLIDSGVIHRLADDNESVTLAAPPEQIRLDRLLDVGFQAASLKAPDDQTLQELIAQLRSAQREAARDATLATIL